MDKEARAHIQRATQAARSLLEEAFCEQLEGTYDILMDGSITELAGSHLSSHQKVTRGKLVAAVAHKRSIGLRPKEAVVAYLREAAFTALNRFVALKMLEARKLVQECVSKGEGSSGFKEFTALAPGLVAAPDKGYRLYIEALFDEIGQEVKVLFDRHDVASLLWPNRQTLLELLGILNAPELSIVWSEDEAIGWVYQFFNNNADIRSARYDKNGKPKAPQNSHELAVRNQFFTPRYVVQFLTDNTLGRTWYEMMQSETELAHIDYLVRRPKETFLVEGKSAPESEVDGSELSQEELLQQTVYVPFRAKKDPRNLRILDPACGSGHFLLYSFDLLITIYEEAWGDVGAADFTESGTQLRADYGSIVALRRATPGLILQHNLHGVDIDPRAAQIAALALWMRAQRAYNQFDVARADRPAIRKTNIVVAEPMPGDTGLMEEFAASLKPTVLGDLFTKMVEEMKLAGEAGSLLKIEESISKAVKEAEEEHRQEDLFTEKIDSEDFWEKADEKIIAALEEFAESAVGVGGVRRRLFAGDAMQGVAFIELIRKRFDVVLMNPPFGDLPAGAKGYLEIEYPKTKNDIYGIFTERVLSCLTVNGCFGAITSRTGFYLKRFEYWRSVLLAQAATPATVADLGQGVLDSAAVETAAYACFKRRSIPCLFIKSDDTTDRSNRILETISHLNQGLNHDSGFVVDPSSFKSLPECKWLYWIPQKITDCFVNRTSFKQNGYLACAGLQTNSDFRFVRLAWEVERGALGRSSTWANFYKGGEYSPFFDDIHLLVNWRKNGYEIKQHTIELGNSPSRHVVNENHYFKPGIGYINISSIGFSPQVLPTGVVFSIQGQAIYGLDYRKYFPMMASSAVAAFLDIINPGRHYQAGQVQLLPVPDAAPSEEIETATLQAIHLKQEQASYLEESRNFVSPIRPNGDHKLQTHKSIWELIKISELVIPDIQKKIDLELNSSYKLDRVAVEYINSKTGSARSNRSSFLVSSLVSGTDSENEVKEWHATSVLSYLMGCCFGRWDIRYATGERQQFELSDPFDPLPVCPPGMLQNADGLTATPADIPDDYPLRISWPGILVDDDGHSEDIIARVRDALDIIWGDRAPAMEQEVCESLSIRSLRNYFAVEKSGGKFFKDHLKRYSKSRRQAPIYWPFSTESGTYTLWAYYQQLDTNTIYTMVGMITDKLTFEERKLTDLKLKAGLNPSLNQRKELDVQERFVAELEGLATELKRVAPLWIPNLNDGVIINSAPIWRMLRFGPWQKKVKDCWDKLCEGDYDWAHLAMQLWPERVVPKCQDDRSLAIAHGLEEEFWYKDDDGQKVEWKKRMENADKVTKFVAERSSTAVKAALEDLINAPSPSGQTRRRRRTS